MPDPEEDDIGLAVRQAKSIRKQEVQVMARRILTVIPLDAEYRQEVIKVVLNRLNELSRDL
jgi:hypothetical protein